MKSRHTFKLYTEENGSFKTLKSDATFSELAAYSQSKIKDSENHPRTWWLKGFENQSHALYLQDKTSIVRSWHGLVDADDHGIADDIGFVTIQHFDLVEGQDPEDDNPAYRLTSLRHLMPIDWVNREINYAVQSQKLEIEQIVFDQVQRGVSQGVAKAIQESTANLEQIKNEKKRIDQQIKELEKERSRIETIEKHLREKEAAKAIRKQSPKSRAGYVYVIRSLTALTYYKIGRSATPEKRMKKFEVTIPFEVEPVLLIQTDDMFTLETELHARFSSKRTDGEWFILDKSDLEYIASLQQST